jgi:hypothetical protein
MVYVQWHGMAWHGYIVAAPFAFVSHALPSPEVMRCIRQPWLLVEAMQEPLFTMKRWQRWGVSQVPTGDNGRQWTIDSNRFNRSVEILTHGRRTSNPLNWCTYEYETLQVFGHALHFWIWSLKSSTSCSYNSSTFPALSRFLQQHEAATWSRQPNWSQ